MLTLGRLIRTMRHVTPGQIGWRAVHELRLATYRRAGTLPARLWREVPQARFLGPSLPPAPGLVERSVADQWLRGIVEYVGLAGRADDWRGDGMPRLWRYERHYHRELVSLAALAEMEPDGPWSRCAEVLIDSWSLASPAAAGDGWEPYPVSRRVLNWSLAGCLHPILGERIAPRLAPQVRFLSRHLERHLLGNHLLCNAAALVAGSAVLDSIGSAEAGHRGLEILVREVSTQVLPDGGYAERTIQYHALVLFDLVLALGLWRARGRTAPPVLLDAVRKMWVLLEQVRRPDGSYPWLNDAAPDSTSPPSRLAALAEAVGLGGLLSVEQVGARDVHLPQMGWQICRAADGELLFEAGPIGPQAQPGHGHSDGLSFELYWRHHPVVVDTGVTTYDAGVVRDFERSARAHAVVTVGNAGPDELWASFRVGARANVAAATPARVGDVRILRGQLTAPMGWIHSRTLVYWPGRALVVADQIVGAPYMTCLARIPLAPEVRREGNRLHFGEETLSLRVLRGYEGSVEQGWVGMGFGRRRPRETITVAFAPDGRAYYAFHGDDCPLEIFDTRLRLGEGKSVCEVELP